MSKTNFPTEQDRAVARRVLRRISGFHGLSLVVTGRHNRPTIEGRVRRGTATVTAGRDLMAAAVEGARLGREYAAALRSGS